MANLLNPGTIFRYELAINSVTPAVPVENSEVSVTFSLRNATLDPTSGLVAADWESQGIAIENLGPGQTYRHVINCKAPKPGSETLTVTYTVPVPGVEFPGPAAEDDAAVEVAGTYTVTFDKINIRDTRSVENDTDYAFLAIRSGDSGPVLQQWKRLGDVDNGDHDVGITLGPVTLASADLLGINYQVINHGYDLADVNTFFNDVSGAAAQVLSDIFVGTSWDKGDDLTKFINSKQFADCDGYTVIDAIGPLDGGRLGSWTDANGAFTIPISYPPSNIDPGTFDKFYGTSAPCGTPHYTVYWTVRRTSWNGTVTP